MSLFIAAVIAGVALLLYRALLPRPLKGIPYNKTSAKRLLGDVPAIKSHIAATDGGTFITYILNEMKKLNAPLIQVFIRPLSKPLLILGDFPEAHDILVRRTKEFDRSHTLGDLVSGLAPDHHIHLPTGSAWKAQRRLVQDLMTPSFLHTVAGPVIYQHVSTLVELWRVKSRIAAGRPWAASDDINQMALDAVMAFAFGEGLNHSATVPTLEAVRAVEMELQEGVKAMHRDEPVDFPRGRVDEALQATLDLTKTVGEVQGNPMPDWKWAYVMRKPSVQKAFRVKEEYIRGEVTKSVERLHQSKERARSAIDQMVLRERETAGKEQREPDYFSRAMIDETFGFIFAGHETTSTTLCWALKFLAEQPESQTKLRRALQTAFSPAIASKRQPTIQEITSTNIPYLDATIEETLRCAGTAPVVDRVATSDTVILGHAVPKGTVVTCLVTGPSMMSAGFDIDPSRRSQSSQTAQKNNQFRAWNPADMSVFCPDRWMAHEGQFNPTAGPQLAFGLGTRGCYGKRLAYLEMRIVLVLVMMAFELQECPPGLSGYEATLITTNEPQKCHVRLIEQINITQKQ